MKMENKSLRSFLKMPAQTAELTSIWKLAAHSLAAVTVDQTIIFTHCQMCTVTLTIMSSYRQKSLGFVESGDTYICQ